MAAWRASGGQCFEAFDLWSQNSKKYNKKIKTEKQWQKYKKSPPTKIGAGTIFYLADKADPTWRTKFEQSDADTIARDRLGKSLVRGLTKAGKQQLLQSSAEFVAGFVPPDYLVDGLLQRRYIYSLTAPTGSGKTAIALRIVAHIALGLELAGREVDQGRVLYFAGENPDDVRARWIKQCEELGQDPDEMDVVFLAGTPAIADKVIRKQIDDEAGKFGDFKLVVIDTSAAYFKGDDENSNTQLGTHARMLRSFVDLPGGPTILVTCHPTKNFDPLNLLPRGGGAFLNEVDGTSWPCVKQAAAL